MADDLLLPLYPEVEARRHLSKKQKAQVVLRQNGRCAGCGIKARKWEFDHEKALWKGDTDQSDLRGWQAFGSRQECDCHLNKTRAEAGERAKMKRVRTDEERHAARMRMKATMTPAAIRREKLKEKIAAGNRKIQSRGFSKQEALPNSWNKPASYVSKLSKEYRRKFGSSRNKMVKHDR